MNVISRVFPNATHLLCRWHISKNVLTNCKKLFMTEGDVGEVHDDLEPIGGVTHEKNITFNTWHYWRSNLAHISDALHYVRSTWLDWIQGQNL